MPSQQSQSRRLRIHRRISEQDRWLDEIGLFRKHIISDSSCLFRAVSENVYKNQAAFHKVRKECVEYMTANETEFSSLVQGSFENYVREMSNAATFGGTIELTVMSHLYRRDFIVFDNNKGPKTFISNGFGKDISLYLIKEKSHYDALFPKEHMETVSFCQSLTYNVLYKGVYEMNDVDFAVRKMLYNESACPHQDYFMAEKLESRRKLQEEEEDNMALEVFKPESRDGSGDSLSKQRPEEGKRSNLTFTLYPINSQNGMVISLDTNSARELLENKILPFPYKVAKALDPNVYRNIELDTWFEIKREEQTSGLYCDGLSLQVGVKCLCRVGGASYHCHIQAMAEDSPCLVFVEELGEMRSVPLDQLRPLPPHEARPWYTPYRKDRNRFSTIAHILKQLGYIGTGKNLHHLRYKVKKSSVSQDLVRFNKEHQGYERKSRNYSSDDYFPKELDYKMEDDNNNEVIWTGEDCSDPTTPISSYDEEKYPSLQYLDKYTHLDNIDPYSVEMVTMPLIVEQSAVNGSLGGHVVENGSRDSSRGPPMSGAYVPSPETISNSVHYTIQNSNGGEHLSPSHLYSLHTHSPIISPGPGGMMWPGYGMLMPPFQPPLQRLPLPLPPPPGVNLAVQRSMNPNGSDLPYHDVQTLRYFFNQGLEWLYSTGALSHALPPLALPAMGAGSLGPAPPTPTPSPPHHAPYPTHPSLHHSRVSPNQLAIDMQQNLTLEDSPNSSVSQELNKNSNKPNNNQRSKNSEYTPRGGGRGGFNLRYRRNDSNNNNNNRNNACNRSQNNNYNNRANFNNGKPKNGNQENGSQLNQPKVEEQPVQDNVSNSLAADNFQANSMAYVSYPPPPLYRIPCYPVAEGEGNVMGVGYAQQYVSYPPGGEEGAPGAEGYPAQYVAYLPPAPPLYYPPTSGYSGYPHYTPATPENHPK